MIAAGLALAVLSTPTQAASADADGYRPRDAAYSFTLTLPSGARLVHREILDFDLYRVMENGRPILNIYEGWSAEVSGWVTDRHTPNRQERDLNGQPVEYFWNKQCDGWSNEVHAWITQDTPPEAAVEARRIADSLTMKPCTNVSQEP